jgi:aminoglycoside phosphotransferase (APT) family kinase protein
MSTFRLLVPTRGALAAALTAAGGLGRVRPADLVELPRRGLAHRHWRIRGRGLVVRVPILPSDDPAAGLRRQAEIFRRAAASGHTPRLHAVLAPRRGLALGALVVAEIKGREPRVPSDLGRIAVALGAIHALPVPPPARRLPLDSPKDPFAATLALIERNLRRAADSLPPETRVPLDAEAAWARRFATGHAQALRTSPCALVVTDAHPRNFVIAADGRAICLDLERAGYGSPAIDLAHAVLPIAVAWGRHGERLSTADRRRFLAAYFKHRGAAARQALQPWLAPFRRLIRLRTTTAYAAFRANGAEAALGPAARRLARRAIAAALDPRRLARRPTGWG